LRNWYLKIFSSLSKDRKGGVGERGGGRDIERLKNTEG